MGLKNGGSISQRMMEWILKDLSGWSIQVYANDVIIGSDSAMHKERMANHAQALKATLDRLCKHQLRVYLAKKKCLFMEEI